MAEQNYSFYFLKENYEDVTFQSFANHAGTAKSYLKLVIEKERHVSLDKISVVSSFFKFSDFEKQCFTYLVIKNTCKDPEIETHFDILFQIYFRFFC